MNIITFFPKSFQNCLGFFFWPPFLSHSFYFPPRHLVCLACLFEYLFYSPPYFFTSLCSFHCTFSCLWFASSLVWMLWAVPLHRQWRGVWWFRALWLLGSGSRHRPLMLNHPKSPSQLAVWYVWVLLCDQLWCIWTSLNTNINLTKAQWGMMTDSQSFLSTKALTEAFAVDVAFPAVSMMVCTFLD